jgi:O-antigen ligase
VAILLAWVTFPGGGVYPWVWVPAAGGALALAILVRPQILSDENGRGIDVVLILSAIAIVLQLLPLPSSLIHWIDPQAIPLRAALLLPVTPLLPISILPRDTLAAFGIFAGATVLFWTCRQIGEQGGTGRIVRSIAVIGIVASVAAIVQRVENRELLYGFWRPLDQGARPYGPFVNRNHFATWAIMACPLIFGYLLARAPAALAGQRISQRIVSAAEQVGSIRSWLAAAVCLMTLAVLLSASRSGVLGLICAFAATMWLSSRRGVQQTRRWMMLQAILLLVVVVSFANFDSLQRRFDETLTATARDRGRTAIWRDAMRVIEDFRWTGTGAGTFGAAVVPYQTTEPGYTIGQAHNQYLQIAAEGGFMISVPAVITLVMFLILFRRRLLEAERSDYLIRAGAGAGISGVLVQSFWETGLRMPANAMLFAVLAAIATCTPSIHVSRERDT